MRALGSDPENPGYAPGPGDAFDAEYLRQRVREDPYDWRRWFQLGALELDRGDRVRACEALTEVVRMQPENGLAHCLLARAMEFTGAAAERVLEVAQRATRLRPDDPSGWRTVAFQHERGGRIAEALDAYTTAARLDPTAETYWIISQCLYRLGRAREALVALEETVRRKPNHLPALKLRARVARDLGDRETARESIRALFGFNPVRARELMERYKEPPGKPSWRP